MLVIQIGSYTQSISKKNCQEQRMMASGPHRPNQIFSDCMAPGIFSCPELEPLTSSQNQCDQETPPETSKAACTGCKNFHKTTDKTSKKLPQNRIIPNYLNILNPPPQNLGAFHAELSFPHLCLDGQAIFGVGFWHDQLGQLSRQPRHGSSQGAHPNATFPLRNEALISRPVGFIIP